MSQPLRSFPAGPDDWVEPTITFRDSLTITVGGEQFDLIHRRGETDDQLYVSIPGRKAVASADYYQGFLPNAGNGKRVQRYIEEWAEALRDMVALEPDHLLPAHGEPLSDAAEIAEVLSVHAEALEEIVAQTLAGLNERLRQDEVVEAVRLPDHLANHRVLNVQYVSVKDIAKMVVKQYCGWWDDIPSHWSGARFDEQASLIVEIAGGVDVVIGRARELSGSDPVLACHLIDWAYFADDTNLDAAAAVIDVYRNRVLHGTRNTQEVLMFLDHMTDARIRLDSAAVDV
jgi:alkyl sulfatase BDS1-like metallo-beta-lactamase superfamily hydrolase